MASLAHLMLHGRYMTVTSLAQAELAVANERRASSALGGLSRTSEQADALNEALVQQVKRQCNGRVTATNANVTAG